MLASFGIVGLHEYTFRFSIFKTNEICILERRETSMAPAPKAPKTVGDAIEPPLHHRSGSTGQTLMQVARLFSLP